MSNRQKIILGVGCFASGILILLYYLPKTENQAASVEKQIRLRLEIKNRSSKLLKDVNVWLYAPVTQTGGQQRTALHVSDPYQITTDQNGNAIVNIQFPRLPPRAIKILVVKADLRLRNGPNPAATPAPGDYLQAERYVQTGSAPIIALAKQLADTEPSRTAANIYQWVSTHLTVTDYVRQDLGADHALEHRKGDCTAFMYLAIALARINGLPARGLGGYVLKESGYAKASNYHNWAEIYLDGAWRLLDAHKRQFMQHADRYIATRIISDQHDPNMAGAHQYRSNSRHVQIRMY